MEFLASVHDYFCRPWVLGEPGELKDVDDIVRLSRRYEFQVEPACDRIHHRDTMERNMVLLFLVSKLVWTNQVDAQSVPGNGFCLFSWHSALFVCASFAASANVAPLAHLLDGAAHAFPTVVLSHGELHSGLTGMHQNVMVPFGGLPL